MLPNQSGIPSVYINPKFKTAHINPNFLPKVQISAKANNIYINPKFKNAHINPNFLHKSSMSAIELSVDSKRTSDNPISIAQPSAKIVSKTNRKLVRLPCPILQQNLQSKTSSAITVVPLVKIGKRKLVRASQLKSVPKVRSPIKVQSKVLRTKYKIVKGEENRQNIYKIDRRLRRYSNSQPIWSPHRSLHYNQSGFNKILASKRVVITNRKLLRIGKTSQKQNIFPQYKHLQSTNKKLELLNINGVFYKSTKTTLKKQNSRKVSQTPSLNKSSPSTTLFVRGEKFILDATGKKLVRSHTNVKSTLKRIDVGRFTFVSTSCKDTYERTENHTALYHLSSAKQKSIHFLTRNLVKSNVVCPIFRRLGKCRGLQVGRCVKVHDIKHVDICQKFLKGTCLTDKCLLSHNVTLSKMPTCKFYLQGICSRTDCPYLHKKFNEKVEICQDFLKGYCEKADQCNMRHEFVFAEMEGKSNLKTQNDKSHTSKLSEKTDHQTYLNTPQEEIAETTRYFVDTTDGTDSNNDFRSKDKKSTKNSNQQSEIFDTSSTCEAVTDETQEFKRPKLGILPSYISID